jgi:DNA polymerase elongation subunit (family B)
MQLKILFWDIETSYLMARIWQPGPRINVSHKQLVPGFDTPRIICIAYKFLGEKTTHALTWNLKTHDARSMLHKISAVIASADLTIGHNGDRFDLRHLNTALLLADLPPLPPHTTEDTLKQARKHFFFPSNSLDYISKLLTDEPKTKCAWEDWVRIIEHNDPVALARMVKYCKQDVRSLEALWKKFTKHCTPKVNASVIINGNREGCPRCGHTRVLSAGYVVRTTGRYKRWHCQGCGHKFKVSRKEPEGK